MPQTLGIEMNVCSPLKGASIRGAARLSAAADAAN